MSGDGFRDRLICASINSNIATWAEKAVSVRIPTGKANGFDVTVQPEQQEPDIALSAAEALQMGLKLHQSGSLSEAEILYRRTLDVVPENLDALHYLGVLCHQQNRSIEAAGQIERIIILDPGNADAHNNLGNVLESLGKIEEAETSYRKAIALLPEHGPAHNNLGVILMSRGKAEEALAAYRRAVEISPRSAEFRCNMGNALRRSGKVDEAVDAYREVINLDPKYLPAWQGLTLTLTRADRLQRAERVFQEWLRLEPGNPVVLYLQAAIVGGQLPDRAPDAYVREVFDEMAERFDFHLLEQLDYRAPDLLMEALAADLPPPSAELVILDAGCGTGLCGPLLRPYARKLTGVDLSKAMLAKAVDRKQYDDLIMAELSNYLGDHSQAYDVIASADTLCYFGNLETVCKNAAQALKPGGLFAFTLEDAGEDVQGVRLADHGRYAHSKSYAEQTLDSAGLTVKSCSSVTLRNEGKQPVVGHLFVVTRD